MEPKGPLPYSQEATNGPYHEPDESSPYDYILLISWS
jgi:hypothetical protein